MLSLKRDCEKGSDFLLIAYISKTGNIERFVQKLPFEHIQRIVTGHEIINEPFIFITYTTGIGEVPTLAWEFCTLNQKNMVAVVASGNRNWGNAYGIAADKISNQFNVPVMMKFELSGRKDDIQKFIEGVRELEIHRVK